MLTANVDERTIHGVMLPYGAPGGRTNLGRVVASAGSVTVPEDPSSVVLNLEHQRTSPIGRATNITEEDDGLHATFKVAATRAGDDLLAEVAEGLRTGLSVEVDSPVIRAGKLLGGVLSACAAVVAPAFPNALMTAADAGEDPETEPEATAEDTTEGTAPDDEEEGDMPENENTSEGQSLAASAPVGLRTPTKDKPVGTGDLFKMLATAHRTGDRQMLAALSDIVPADVVGIEQPQYVGELWSGKAYERRIVPLFNHADLTSFKVSGWRWVTKPVVAAYAGNKGAVPSGTVETEQVDIAAERIAGAHDIDRKFRDFGDEEFWRAYYAAMTESYAQQSDSAVLTDAVTAAGTAIAVGTIPTDVAPGMVGIVDGAIEVLENTNALPTFAVLATDLWRGVLLTKKDDVLAYLNAALGLEDGSLESFRIVPSGSLTDGQVLVGARSAMTVHELGGSPVRVEALNVANGGIDAGVFGYYATNVHDDGGLVLVDTTSGS